ncbi:MAG: GNAT family N-acetyltransferase [Actinobacteria bacterium]|nr:GNAT family N-acetyltransferase [Actinomycetota bacterium]
MTAGSIVVRPAESQADLTGIDAVDVSYSTDRIYRVRRNNMAFWLEEERFELPVEKADLRPARTLSDGLFVACQDGEIVGYGELRPEPGTGRVRIESIFVSRSARGQGVGGRLIEALAEQATHQPGARCLWLETQNVNYPAVQFYLKMGFRLCGLDETLYQPDDPQLLPGEMALYFTRDLAR